MVRLPLKLIALSLFILGTSAGCDSPEQKVIPDPALANKPFPKVELPGKAGKAPVAPRGKTLGVK